MQNRVNMFNKMLDILSSPQLCLDDSVDFAIYIHGRLSRLPQKGTLAEIREVAILHQEWFNACIPIIEACRICVESVPGGTKLLQKSTNVGKAKFYETVETIEDFQKRWTDATSTMDEALKEKMEVAHAT